MVSGRFLSQQRTKGESPRKLGSRYTMPHLLTVAGEATARSCTSNMIVITCREGGGRREEGEGGGGGGGGRRGEGEEGEEGGERRGKREGGREEEGRYNEDVGTSWSRKHINGATEAGAPSVFTSVILMISPLLRHSFLLSSSTVFMLSIHSVSTGPSNTYHFLSIVVLEAPPRIIEARMPSVLRIRGTKIELSVSEIQRRIRNTYL